MASGWVICRLINRIEENIRPCHTKVGEQNLESQNHRDESGTDPIVCLFFSLFFHPSTLHPFTPQSSLANE